MTTRTEAQKSVKVVRAKKTPNEKLITTWAKKIARLDARIKDLQAKRDVEEATLDELRAKHGKPNDFTQRIHNPKGEGQPFSGPQAVVLEKRCPFGNLNFTPEQPPTHTLTFSEVHALHLTAVPTGDGSWTSLRAWLDSKGWIVRAKTW